MCMVYCRVEREVLDDDDSADRWGVRLWVQCEAEGNSPTSTRARTHMRMHTRTQTHTHTNTLARTHVDDGERGHEKSGIHRVL